MTVGLRLSALALISARALAADYLSSAVIGFLPPFFLASGSVDEPVGFFFFINITLILSFAGLNYQPII